MSGIFISYRREDSAEEAHSLYQALRSHFGADGVFIDVENIGLGENFAAVIDEKVGFCDALIAIIGTKWLNSADKEGARRLDDPDDWVRLEILSAINRGIKVIPVLVNGATPPGQQDLPYPLAALAQFQALDLHRDHFNEGVARLTSALKTVGKRSTTASLWFSIITKRHKALDPLDLHKPEVLRRALRFMLYMLLIEAMMRIPIMETTQANSKPWYLLAHIAANYIQYLGIGFILHFSMKVFGGQATLQKSIAAFCFLTAYAPLIAISQAPVWGLNVSVLKDATDIAWRPEQSVAKMQAFVSTIGLFGILRLIVAFLLATFLWALFFSAVFESFRTLHRLNKGIAFVAFALGLIVGIGFVGLVVVPYFGAVYGLLPP